MPGAASSVRIRSASTPPPRKKRNEVTKVRIATDLWSVAKRNPATPRTGACGTRTGATTLTAPASARARSPPGTRPVPPPRAHSPRPDPGRSHRRDREAHARVAQAAVLGAVAAQVLPGRKDQPEAP